MSFSNPYFTNSRPVKYRPADGISDVEFNKLHWSEQLRLRPLRDRKRFVQGEGDSDNRLDNWETPEDYDTNDKEIT